MRGRETPQNMTLSSDRSSQQLLYYGILTLRPECRFQEGPGIASKGERELQGAIENHKATIKNKGAE